MISNRPLITFFMITFGFSWSVMLILLGLYEFDVIGRTTLDILYNFGALGPVIGAVGTVSYFYGKAGRKKLVNSLFYSIKGKAWPLAVSPLVFLALALIVYPFWTGDSFSFSITKAQFDLTGAASVVSWILPFICYAVCEEIGWRGFVLPHLQERHSAITATYILTIFWGIWYIPILLMRHDFNEFVLVGFFTNLFMGSIILTSLYNLTRGSILVCMVFHLCMNLVSAMDKDKLMITVNLFMIATALLLAMRYKGKNLSPRSRMGNYYGKLYW